MRLPPTLLPKQVSTVQTPSYPAPRAPGPGHAAQPHRAETPARAPFKPAPSAHGVAQMIKNQQMPAWTRTSESAIKPAQATTALRAKFGIEMQIPGVRVQPFQKRGTLLLEGQGWKLETDADLNNQHAELEFVLSPMADKTELDKAMAEITALIATMRQRALAAPGKGIALASLSSEAKVACELHVSDIRFRTRLQTTYGVGLEQLAGAMPGLLGAKQADTIHRANRAVADYYQREHGAPLSPAALGMVNMINMYLERAKAARSFDGTVHSLFRMMARSDFCAMHDHLLDDADRAQLARLLLPGEGASTPALMTALGLDDPDALVFKRPYYGADVRETEQGPTRATHPGPAIKDWLASIVNGRGEGRFKKDLMSPPPGYRLHTGDLAADYGMGAMQVDAHNKLILFEMRGAMDRPANIAMNGQIKHAVLREYVTAHGHNPGIALDGARPDQHGARHAALDLLETAHEDLAGTADVIARHGQDVAPRTWKAIQNVSVASARRSLTQAAGALGGTGIATQMALPLARMQAALDRLSRMGAPRQDPAQVSACMAEYRQSLTRFEQALWLAGDA